MAIENNPVVRFQNEYVWTEQNFEKLAQVIKSILSTVQGADVKFLSKTGQHNLLSVTTEHEYETYESWYNETDINFDSTNIRINHWERNLNIDISADFNDKTIEIWIHTHKNETENVNVFFKFIETELQLEKRNYFNKSRSFLERIYYLAKPKESIEFIETFNQFINNQKNKKVDIELLFATPSGSGVRYSDQDQWGEVLTENWTKITSLNCRLHDQSFDLDLRWNFLADELRLRVDSPLESLVEVKLRELEQILKVIPYEGKLRFALEGGERIFFSQNQVTKQWFETAVETITNYLRSDFYSELRLKISSKVNQTLVWQNIPIWKDNVLNNWEEMIEATGYFSGPGLTLNFRYDHKRERIILEIRTTGKERTDKIFTDFIQKLDLEQSSGDIYSHPRSSGYFSINTFNYPDFEKAIKDTVTQFIKNKYYILEATVIEPTDDERKAVQTFTDFAAFLKRIGNNSQNDKVYDEVHLKIQGPRGAAIGIHLLNKRSKLEIKSSLNSNEFINLVQIFKNNIGLKKIADTKEDAEVQKKSIKDSAWLLIGLPIFLSLLTNAFLTDRIKNAPFANDSLEITTPSSSEKDKPIIINDTIVTVSWRIIHERWLNKKFLENNKATVRIKDSVGVVVKEKINALPGTTFNLKPGRYSVEVFSEDFELIKNESFNIRFR